MTSPLRTTNRSRRPSTSASPAAARPLPGSIEPEQKALQRFRAAMDKSSDSIYLIDRATMRFVDVNDTGCRYFGYTREEFLKLGPQDVLCASLEALEGDYDQLIANDDAAETVDIRARRKDGTVTHLEMGRRATRVDGRWIIVSTGRDIAERDAERDRAERALRASEERYRGILENIEDAYYEVDLRGNLVFFNSAFVRLLGYPAAELQGLNNRKFQSPEAAAKVYATFNEVYRTGIPANAYDWEMQGKDDRKVLVEGSVQLVRDANGEATGFRGMLREVTSRRAMEQALRESEERFRSLIELSSDWYWEMDSQFRFVRMERKRDAAETASNHDVDLGKRPWETDIGAESGWEAHRELLLTQRPFHDFVTHRRQPDGSRRYASITGEPVFDAAGHFRGYRGIGRDITAAKLAQQHIQYLATHDSLTNLPNRAMFNELLGVAVQSAQRHANGLAVLFIDLDGFKSINDTLGHDAGDCVLRTVAARLKEAVRGSDIVTRLGGDEFVVLLQDISGIETVAMVAHKILSAVAQPVDLNGSHHRVTASVGISHYPDDTSDGSLLLQYADMAMYIAKEQGKNTFRFHAHDEVGRRKHGS